MDAGVSGDTAKILTQKSKEMIKYQKQRMRLLLVAMALLALGAPTAAWATDLKPAACVDTRRTRSAW